MKHTLYLLGLINTDIPETIAWRVRAAECLEDTFNVLDPLRGKHALCCTTVDSGITSSAASGKSILTRDYQDVMRSDVILANLQNYGSQRPMVGSMMEMAWAWENRTPVVAICGISSNVYSHDYLMRNHPFVSQIVTEYWGDEMSAFEFLRRYHASM